MKALAGARSTAKQVAMQTPRHRIGLRQRGTCLPAIAVADIRAVDALAAPPPHCGVAVAHPLRSQHGNLVACGLSTSIQRMLRFKRTAPTTSTKDRMLNPRSKPFTTMGTRPRDNRENTQGSLTKRRSITIRLRDHGNGSIQQLLRPYTILLYLCRGKSQDHPTKEGGEFGTPSNPRRLFR